MKASHPFVRWLKRRDACEPAILYVRGQKSPQSAWSKCTSTRWMFWLLARTENNEDYDKIRNDYIFQKSGFTFFKHIKKKYPRNPWFKLTKRLK